MKGAHSTQRALLVVLLTLGLTYAHHIFIQVPWRIGLENMQARVIQTERENREGRQRVLADAARLESRVLHLESEVQRMELRLPDDRDMPRLLNRLQVQSQGHGLEILSFQPMEVEQEAGAYLRERYRLSIQGFYHDVGRFMATIAALPELLRPSVLGMGLAPPGRVSVVLEVETFLRPEHLPDRMDRSPLGQGLLEAVVPLDRMAYPTDDLRDPTVPERPMHPHTTWEHLRLRGVFLAPDPDASLATLDGMRRGEEGPHRTPLTRVRVGEVVEGFEVLRILEDAVYLRFPAGGASSSEVIRIPLRRGPHGGELR